MFKKLLPIIFVFLFSVISRPVVGSDAQISLSTIQGSPVQRVAQLILNKVYQNLDYTVNYQVMPAKRALKMSRKGETDGETVRIWDIGIINPTLLRVPTPVFYLKGYAYRLNGPPIMTVEELESKLRVGIQRGITWSEKIVLHRKGVVRVGSAKELARKLITGAIDVAIYADFGFEDEVQLLGWKEPLIKGQPVFNQALYHYLHEKNEKLVDPVNAVLEEMSQSGELEKLYTAAMEN